MISSYGFTASTEIEVVVQRIGKSLNLSEIEKVNCVTIFHENWIFNLKTLLHVPIDLLLVLDLQPSFKQELCKVCMYLSKPDSQFSPLDLENARVLTLNDTQKVHITASLKTLVQLDGGLNTFFKKFCQGLLEEGTVSVYCPSNGQSSACFLRMISWLVENIHKSHIGSDLDVIGASHMVYGMGPRHYEVFVNVFCATMESFFNQLATERAERPEKETRGSTTQRESLERSRTEHASHLSTAAGRERDRERDSLRDSARDREGASSSGACSLHSSCSSIPSSSAVELPAMEEVQAISSAWHQCLTQVTGLMMHAANFMKQGVKFTARVSRGSSQVRYAILLFNSLQLYKDEKYFSLSGNYPLQCASVTYPEKEKSRPFYVDIRCFNPVYELLLVLDTEADYVMLQDEFAWRLKALKRARNLERLSSNVTSPVLMDTPLSPLTTAGDLPNDAPSPVMASSSALPSSVFVGAAQHVPTNPAPHSALRQSYVSMMSHSTGQVGTPRIMTTQPPSPHVPNNSLLTSSLEKLPSPNRSPRASQSFHLTPNHVPTSRPPSTGVPTVTTTTSSGITANTNTNTSTNTNTPEKEKERERDRDRDKEKDKEHQLQPAREGTSRKISLPSLAQPMAKSLLQPPPSSNSRPSSQKAPDSVLSASISSGSLSSSLINNAQWVEEPNDIKPIPPLTFDPTNKAIVIRTWKLILNLPQGVNLLVRLFYQLFFEVNPTALRLFRGVSIDTQGRALMVMINFIISNIDDTDALDIKLKHLGGRHMIYGVLPSDYTLFVTQLGRTVCTVLAGKPEEKDKEPEDMVAVCAAWESVFAVIADVMYLRGNEIQREGFSCEIERKIKSANQGYWEMNTCTMVFDKLLFYSSKDKDPTSLRPLTIPLSTIALVEVKTKDGMRLVNISLKNRMKHYWFRCPQNSPFIQELSWRLEANMWPVTDDPLANSPRSTYEGKADALIMDKDTLRSPVSTSRKKKTKETREGK